MLYYNKYCQGWYAEEQGLDPKVDDRGRQQGSSKPQAVCLASPQLILVTLIYHICGGDAS